MCCFALCSCCCVGKLLALSGPSWSVMRHSDKVAVLRELDLLSDCTSDPAAGSFDLLLYPARRFTPATLLQLLCCQFHTRARRVFLHAFNSFVCHSSLES